MKELIAIQAELRVPKNQTNAFGGFNYRSCEDITEAVKPLLQKYGCALTMEDRVEQRGQAIKCKDVIEIGDGIQQIETVKGLRFFTISTATLINSAGERVTCSAEAEHPEYKKGMDPAQLSGATASYARKYALGGLFALDDCKDPDATNTHGKAAPEPVKRGHAPAPKANPAPAQAKPQTPQEAAPAAPAQSKQAAFLAKLGVTPEMVESAFGASLDKLTEADSAALREVCKLMIADRGLTFEDAVERAAITAEPEAEA